MNHRYGINDNLFRYFAITLYDKIHILCKYSCNAWNIQSGNGNLLGETKHATTLIGLIHLNQLLMMLPVQLPS